MSKSREPSTSWSAKQDGFVIHLPTGSMPLPTELVSVFQEQLPSTAEEEEAVVPLTPRPAASSSVAASAPADPVHAGNAPGVAHAIPSRAPPQQVHVPQRARAG